MSTLMERIAAKKALAEAVNLHTPPVEVDILGAPVPTIAESPATAVASVPEGKPLSFKEKMALKASGHSTTTAPIVDAQPVLPPSEKSLPVESTEAKVLMVQTDIVVAIIDEDQAEEPDLSSVSPEDQQAYIDIKTKINMLSSMSEDGLKDAMSDLKKALLKNPQACYLILPHDIGEMVIALRAMKNEAVVEAESTAAGKKGPKKIKASKALTADEISQAFDEM